MSTQDVPVLVNPTSGRGRGGRYAQVAIEAMGAGGAVVQRLQGVDAADAVHLARQAVEAGADRLYVVGGDGMVHLGLQAVAGTDTALGIIPAGTGDDFARLLGIPRRDPASSAQALLHGQVRTIDAGQDGDGRWFAGVVAAGFDSLVNDRANQMRWPKGQARYPVAVLAELRTFEALRFRIVLDGVQTDGEAMMVAVANGRSYGGGMLVCPESDPADGLLDVLVAERISKAAFVRIFPRVYRGKHLSHPAVTVHRAKEVRLESAGVSAYADGELLGPLPRSFRCVPGALRVVVPAAS